jgi:Uma2 family endonuclease
MAIEFADRPVRPLTVDDVMRMVEAGILDENEPVELLHGVLWKKAVKSPEHEELKARLNAWLRPGTGPHQVRVEGALVVPDRTSLPEPDIVVVEPGNYLRGHPSHALLVIEVAASSLRLDTTAKSVLYAQTGTPECWVVDVDARRVHVFREPEPDGYASHSRVGPGEVIEPLHVDVEPLDLAELFRGL